MDGILRTAWEPSRSQVSRKSSRRHQSLNQTVIAACAAATHSVILTFDDHFRHVKRVGRVLLG